MTFTAQREEKEKNLKNFANNFFMDIILKKKRKKLKMSSLLSSSYIIKNTKVILYLIIMLKLNEHKIQFSEVYNPTMNKLCTSL